ncbi:MAG: hypothetical protein ABEJ98_00995 [Candidatus Nanohaloarchaea archaeon]
MSSRGKVVIASLLLLFTGAAAAPSAPNIDMDDFLYLDTSQGAYRLPGGHVDRMYRTYFDFSIPCNGNCPDNPDSFVDPWDTVGQRIELCGKRVKVVRKPSPVNGVDYLYEPKSLSLNSYPSGLPIINGPGSNSKSISCPPGKIGPMEFYYWDGSQYKLADKGGTITLYPHPEGKYIQVLTEKEPIQNALPMIDKPPQLYAFRMSPDVPPDADPSEVSTGDVVVQDMNPVDNLLDMFSLSVLQGDWNPLSSSLSVDYIAKKVEKGARLNSDTESFNSVFQDPFKYGVDCTKNDDEPCNTAMRTFETALNVCLPEPYVGVACGPKCSLAHAQETYCSGSYTATESEKLFAPTSDVIYGWEYPRNGKDMCPSGYETGLNCNKYTETPMAGGPGLYLKDNKPKFHICGDGLTLLEGKVVYSPSAGKKDQFRCSPQKGRWIPVTECNDGVDNDGNGKIDAPNSWYQKEIGNMPSDPKCGSTSVKNEGTNTCPEATVARISLAQALNIGENDRKVALYTQSETGKYRDQITGCRYKNIQKDYRFQVDGSTLDISQVINQGKEDQLAYTYMCNTDKGEIASHPHVSVSSTIRESSLSKNNIRDKVAYYAQRKCLNSATVTGHGKELAVAQIQIPQSLLPFGKEYATPNGFKPISTQSLQEFEQKVFGTGNPTASDLKDKGMNATVSQPYEAPKQKDSLQDSWTVGNYLAVFNDRINGVSIQTFAGLPAENPVRFTGGFAGKCPPGKSWGYYKGEWRCSGEPNYIYILPDIEKGTENVGVKIPGSTLQSLQDNYNANIDKIKTACWKGNPSNKPATLSGSRKVDQPIGNTVGWFVTLPVSGVDTSTSGTYTCNFTVTTEDGRKVAQDRSLWINWWRKKDAMDRISKAVKDIAQRNDLSYRSCYRVFDVPCDTFTNMSTLGETVGSNFFQKESLVPSEEKAESKTFNKIFQDSTNLLQ